MDKKTVSKNTKAKTDARTKTVPKRTKTITKRDLVDFRTDGWKNVISGLGTNVDKRSHTRFDADGFMQKHVLADLYAGDGLIQRIVDSYPDDMTRQWIKIPEDVREDDGKLGVIEKELQRLGAQKAFNTSLKWARLMGGSLLFIGAQDGRGPDQPLNIDKIKQIEFLRIFDLGEIDTSGSTLEKDIKKPNYGKIVKYRIQPKVGGAAKAVEIHASRCIPFHGIEIPVSSMAVNLENRYWGISAIQPVWEYVRDFIGAMGSVSQILYEFVIGKYKLADLDEILAQGNEQALQVRIQAIEMTKSLIKAVLLGTDEEYTRDSASLSGIPDTLDRFMMLLSSVTGIPVTRLFGRSPAGLNATGENDTRNYYDAVKAKQENELTPTMSYLIEIVASSVGQPATAFEWNPLHQLTQKEEIDNDRIEAESYRTQADGDQRYIAEGVLDAEEVYKLRFEKTLGKKDFNELEDLPVSSTKEKEEEEGAGEENKDSTDRPGFRSRLLRRRT